MIDRDIPSYIRMKRRALGESMEEFGRRFGVTTSAVSLWESGKRLPYPQALEAIQGDLKPQTTIKVRRTEFDTKRGLPVFILKDGRRMVPDLIGDGVNFNLYWKEDDDERRRTHKSA